MDLLTIRFIKDRDQKIEQEWEAVMTRFSTLAWENCFCLSTEMPDFISEVFWDAWKFLSED